MRQPARFFIFILVTLTTTRALAQSCEQEVGFDLAAVFVEQCLDVSPATHPPCNVENSCEMIQDELARGCALLVSDSPELVPDYCAEYIQSE